MIVIRSNMKNLTKLIFIAFLTIPFFFSPSTLAEEGNTNGFIVSPSSRKVILSPGETVTQTISISNPHGAIDDVKFEVSVNTYGVKNTDSGDYDPDLETISSSNAIINWIELDETTGVVAPNDTKTISYTITVPQDAPGGGQYAVLTVSRLNDSDSKITGVGISDSFAINSIIYTSITGETRETGKIIENTIPRFIFTSPLTATTTVENSGNIHTEATYLFEVFPLFSNETIYTNEKSATNTSLIMPGTKRLHSETWQGAPKLGIFKVRQTVTIFGETNTLEKTVFICPLWFLALIIFALFAAIVWITARAKARRQKF